MAGPVVELAALLPLVEVPEELLLGLHGFEDGPVLFAPDELEDEVEDKVEEEGALPFGVGADVGVEEVFVAVEEFLDERDLLGGEAGERLAAEETVDLGHVAVEAGVMGGLEGVEEFLEGGGRVGVNRLEVFEDGGGDLAGLNALDFIEAGVDVGDLAVGHFGSYFDGGFVGVSRVEDGVVHGAADTADVEIVFNCDRFPSCGTVAAGEEHG